MSHRFFREFISRNGASAISTAIPTAARAIPPASRRRSVPFSEIIKAWHGQLAYDPGADPLTRRHHPGEWDGLMLDDDARWLFDAFTQSPIKRDIKIGRGTHLMHLEAMRPALWRESINFLLVPTMSHPIPA